MVTAPVTPDATTDGSLSEWAYHHYGVIGLSSRLWQGPELQIPAAGSRSVEQHQETKSDGKVATGVSIPESGPARWLYWNDQIMKGRVFLPFVVYDHPSLGKVELGGWKPGVLLNPPIEEVNVIARSHQHFLSELARRLPRLSIAEVKVEPRGKGIFELKASVLNEGYLPTALVRGIQSRKAPPIQVHFDPGSTRLLAGPIHQKLDTLRGLGGRHELRWVLMVSGSTTNSPKSSSVTLSVSSPKGGRFVQRIPIDSKQ